MQITLLFLLALSWSKPSLHNCGRYVQWEYPCAALTERSIELNLFIYAEQIENYAPNLMVAGRLIKVQNLPQPFCQTKKKTTLIQQLRNTLNSAKMHCYYFILSIVYLRPSLSLGVQPRLVEEEVLALDFPSDWRNVLKGARRWLIYICLIFHLNRCFYSNFI